VIAFEPLTEPAAGALVAAAAFTAGAICLLVLAAQLLAPPRIVAAAPTSDVGRESPAVVSLLTNGFVVTPYAAVATLLDLVARGWLRIEAVDGEVVLLADRRGQHGDVLTSYEQQVLNHIHKLSAGAQTGVSGAGIEVAGLRLPARWRRRFAAAVIREARRAGLCRRRWNWLVLLGPTAALVAGGWQLWRSGRDGDQTAIADSLPLRATAILVAVVIVVTARRIVLLAASQAQRPTKTGRERAATWMGLRDWMEPRGFEHASSTVAANPSRALGYACAFGLARRACEDVPIVPEDDRLAWSNAAGRWHVVRVRYPFRLGYGRHPFVVLLVGVALGIGILLLQRALLDISKGHTLAGWIDEVADQRELIHDIAVGLAAALVVPLLGAAWLVVAGAFDLVATVERRGVVVRARRPQRVVPYPWLLGALARRDRYSLFVAIDDGRADRVGSWLATERTAVPQGANARMRATPLLGYVRSSEPIGAYE